MRSARRRSRAGTIRSSRLLREGSRHRRGVPPQASSLRRHPPPPRDERAGRLASACRDAGSGRTDARKLADAGRCTDPERLAECQRPQPRTDNAAAVGGPEQHRRPPPAPSSRRRTSTRRYRRRTAQPSEPALTWRADQRTQRAGLARGADRSCDHSTSSCRRLRWRRAVSMGAAATTADAFHPRHPAAPANPHP